MRIPYFQVNAFTKEPFGGNPAGVCPLKEWPSDALLQAIAAENNLSETAFFVREDGAFHLRWFTPLVEVDLCGHATLATAFVLFCELDHAGETLRFRSRSGWLMATRSGGRIELDFPSRPPEPCAVPEELARGLGGTPREVLRSRDYMAVFESADEVAALAPDLDLLARLDCPGVIATAAGGAADFVSRFFAPRCGIPEDPVTGSAHCTLIPFWAKRLGKSALFARQISRRGGELFCVDREDRVTIGGEAVVYKRGELVI